MNRVGWRRVLMGGVALAMLSGIGWSAAIEMRTSRGQARVLSWFAKDITYTVREGPSPTPVPYPTFGPYDDRLGYIGLPSYVKALTGKDLFAVEMQARTSSRFDHFVRRGGFAAYREKTSAGLTLFDRNGSLMFSARYPERVYARFDDVPPVVAATLLFIENRELLDPYNPKRNPAVEWDRFASAVLTLPLQWVRPGMRVAGGSTLATQIEKYRHSPDGQTAGATEKLRQMITASVRAYLDGEETIGARRRIIVDYLNSTPLTARSGFGEVNGLGDGLWAWYGTDLEVFNRVMRENPGDPGTLPLRALAYKQALSLLLAQRRPSHYLIADRSALERLANSYLRLLADAGVIGPELRDAAIALPLRFREELPAAGNAASFVEQKAPNAIRARLLSMMGVPSLYKLDRMDLTVETTLDAPTQKRVIEVLSKLGDPAFIHAQGLDGERLLQRGDPANVIYSVTLFERGPEANYVRVQADNLDQPMDINEGAKLDLGSTAKLRTLVTYLEIIAELHGRYGHLPARDLKDIVEDASDPLTRWAAEYLTTAPDRSLRALLEAAMERRYSASPGEAFFTGGGLHTFVNFDRKHDGAVLPLWEAFRFSVNLPFIRLMRDVVQFYVAEGDDDAGELLGNPDHPARHEYLARFVDREGSDFLSRFYTDYRKRTPDEALALLAGRARPVPNRIAVIFRAVRPKASVEEFSAFMKARLPNANLDEDDLSRIYSKFPPGKYSLNDLGYLAGIHPLELWLVTHLQSHPEATRREILETSVTQRQESYSWLFKKGLNAQNTRIRIQLEGDAFKRVTAAWRRVGYPFDTLIPSYATAIGSSADRPAALADLMGIIVNDGVRQPTVRVKRLHFAAATPYETIVGLGPLQSERVMKPEVAQVLRKHLMDVAESGTAKRVHGAFVDPAGNLMAVGGKTGTGDHRFERYGPGGIVLESRVVNRTATFVFFIGDRFFGTMTAFVHGPEAAKYRFTSALPSQLLKSLASALQPLINNPMDFPNLRSAEQPGAAVLTADSPSQASRL